MTGVLDPQAPYLANQERRPFPAQWDFYTDTHKDVAAFCGVRSGKTYGGAEKFVARIVGDLVAYLEAEGSNDSWRPLGARPMVGRDQPRSTYWVIAPTYDLARLAWAMARNVLRRLGDLILHEIDGVVWLKTGILIERKTGSNETQLQGASLSGVWIDEVCTIPHESYLQIRNRLTDAEGWAVMTGSPRPGTWAKDTLWDRAGENPNLSVRSWTTEENPYIPREAIEEAREQLPARWYRRDFLASWESFAGLVYDDYLAASDGSDRGSIVDLDRADFATYNVDACLDFGRRRPAFLLLAEVPGIASDGGVGDVVIEELVAADILEERWLRECAAVCKSIGVRIRHAYCDPAGRARNAQTGISSVDALRRVFADEGVLDGDVLWPSSIYERSIASGIEAVASRFRSASGVRRLFVERGLTDPVRLRGYPRSVVGMHGSISGYVWPDKPGKDDPVKDGVHDHFVDALRYGLVCKYGVVSAPDIAGMNATSRAVGFYDGGAPSRIGDDWG